MTEPVLRFERRSMGIYPCLFHAGPFYWPVPQEALVALKAGGHTTPDAFLQALIAAVAVTPYLKHQVETVLAGLDDRDAHLRAVQASLTAT